MRKDVLNPQGYKLFNAVDMSINQTSDIVYIPFLDNPGIVVSWNGTSPVGTLEVQVANQQTNPNESIIWASLFSSPISITGNSGTHLITGTQVPFNALRLKYTASSGSGDLTAIIQVKMV